MRIRARVSLAAFVALLVVPAAAGANPTSNLELVHGALRDAVTTLVTQAGLLPAGSVVELRGLTPLEANWLAEHTFSEVLTARGFHPVVTAVEPAKQDSTVHPGPIRTSSFADTLAGTAPYAFEYRVVELTLTYPRVWHPHLVGGRRVERTARAVLIGRVRKTSTDEVLWVGQGNGSRHDEVSASELRSLSTGTMPLTTPAAAPPSRGISRFVEPVLVVAIVASLVSLFYSNR